MKHFTTILCAAIMLFGMSACAQKNNQNTPNQGKGIMKYGFRGEEFHLKTQ